MKIIFFVLLFSSLAGATTSFDKPIKTMAFVNGTLMAVPVMPISFATKKGQNTLSLRPAYFSADSGIRIYDGARWEASFKGKGLAVMYNWQWLDRLSFYVLGMYNQLDEGQFLGRGSDPSDPQQDVLSKDVNANFFQSSIGLTLQVINSQFFALQLLVGPTYTVASAEQRVVQEDPSDPDEFIMKVHPSVKGGLLGVQLGIKFSDYFAINPFYMISIPFGDNCIEYDMEVIQQGDLAGLSDRDCTTNSGIGNPKPLVEYDTNFKTMGINFLVPKWGLSINAFVKLEDIQGIEGTDPELYYITVSF